MAIIFEKYDNENLIDYCWYDSSNVKFSKCYDKKDDYKDIDVTFKDGRTYRYFNVIVQDYILFKHGGVDNSQGKALNKFIKKYKCERIEDNDISKLNEECQLLIEESKKDKDE